MRKAALIICTVVALAAGLLAPPAASGAAPGSGKPGGATASPQGWALADQIRDRVRPPKFPRRWVPVTKFGADPTGARESTEAFRRAIAYVNRVGGGHVVVPEGTFLTGAIHLRSNVDLHLTAKAVVKFSQETTDYLPLVYTRWEGVELYNYSAFIYAYGVKNVAVTGTGTLDGQADATHWWDWKASLQAGPRAELFRMAEEGVPVEQRRFGEGGYLRPNFVQFYRSRDIMLRDVRMINSPMWMVHPVLSQNVLVDGVRLDSHGPNNDGVNPESSKNVVIRDSSFNNGDDCIAIKSGRNADGRRVNVPSENILVENNQMADGHGGVVMGSEMSGSVRNVFAQNNTMNSPNLDRALRIKTNAVRGGVVENVYFRDNTVLEVGGEVIWIDFYYEEGAAGSFIPTVRNIYIERLRSNGGKYGLYLRGFEQSPITNINLTDVVIDNVETPMLLENVSGLHMTNVLINGQPYDT